MQVRSTGEPELLQAQRRRREQREADRTITTEPRRARRRRQSAPWLQRNALNAAAISVLIAFLGLGFGLLQMLNGADGSGPLYLAPSDGSDVPTSTDNPDILQAAVASPRVRVGASGSGTDSASQGQPAIHFSAKVIEPNYTVAAGDTLVKIADRFNTSVDRIEAFNNLSDPRALRVGTKLVIPPPF